ncbi:origin recognition complex subunit 6 [Bicyclus anynana]|uniref:Origin recognition complex subunit 6 n=1 Tax=Bicyclus anynana TaxID=110368 RepID=A0A6J1NC93_BICAN|nr:origin recognition complex subunit 6 [Bicyclus anynana]
MAVHNNKTLKLIATKLGLGEEEKVLNKAAEFERLLQTKSIAGSNMTDTSKTVICLDLAAGIYGADLDSKTAIKYSGLRGPTYMNCRKIVENLLELSSDRLTVSFLCASLQCTGVQSLAEKILEEYQRQKIEIDLSLPQYVCMAVYQACRLNKVKVTKSKLIEKSRLKPGQWTKLDADWTKIVDEKFSTLKKRGRPPKDKENVYTEAEKMEVDVFSPNKEKLEPEVEPYDDWKKRMLASAYEQLRALEESRKNEDEYRSREKQTKDQRENKMKMKEFTSPRRSPRKTPQKFSPYKSPSTKPITAIRLLFPREL